MNGFLDARTAAAFLFEAGAFRTPEVAERFLRRASDPATEMPRLLETFTALWREASQPGDRELILLDVAAALSDLRGAPEESTIAKSAPSWREVRPGEFRQRRVGFKWPWQQIPSVPLSIEDGGADRLPVRDLAQAYERALRLAYTLADNPLGARAVPPLIQSLFGMVSALYFAGGGDGVDGSLPAMALLLTRAATLGETIRSQPEARALARLCDRSEDIEAAQRAALLTAFTRDAASE